MLTGPDLDAAVERAELRAAGSLGYEVFLDGKRIGTIVSVTVQNAQLGDVTGLLRGFTFRGGQTLYLEVQEALRGLLGTVST